MPPLTGTSRTTAVNALCTVLPALCYAVILSYGVYARRSRVSDLSEAAVAAPRVAWTHGKRGTAERFRLSGASRMGRPRREVRPEAE